MTDQTSTANPNGRTVTLSRFASNWSVLPMRIFLAALFAFAGYAKLSYPGFLDPKSTGGFAQTVTFAQHGTPLGGLLGPMADHPSVFGHITAYAEFAIGAGLLVGFLARIAALGGIVLTTMIALTVDWAGIKQYTGSSGWYTSVDIAVAVALTVFVIGGPGPLSLDRLYWVMRQRRRAREDAEPSFHDTDLEASRARLRGDVGPTSDANYNTQQLPTVPPAAAAPIPPAPAAPSSSGSAPTAAVPPAPAAAPTPPPVDRAATDATETRPVVNPPEENSLWTHGRQ